MSKYINLFEELNDILNENDKKLSDIKWIGLDGEGYFNTKQFLKIAKGFDYHDGFGLIEIHERLKVVGKDWWLERHEYDGSEWWEFKTLPKQPKVLIEGSDEEVTDKIWDESASRKVEGWCH